MAQFVCTYIYWKKKFYDEDSSWKWIWNVWWPPNGRWMSHGWILGEENYSWIDWFTTLWLNEHRYIATADATFCKPDHSWLWCVLDHLNAVDDVGRWCLWKTTTTKKQRIKTLLLCFFLLPSLKWNKEKSLSDKRSDFLHLFPLIEIHSVPLIYCVFYEEEIKLPYTLSCRFGYGTIFVALMHFECPKFVGLYGPKFEFSVSKHHLLNLSYKRTSRPKPRSQSC